MTATAATTATELTTTKVYRVFIKAPIDKVWAAVTDPEWNSRYGYHCRADYDLEVGGAYRCYPNEEMKSFGAPDVIIDGQIVEVDPPNRLVQTWRALWEPDLEAEGFTTVTFELTDGFGDSTRLTVTHELTGAPVTAIQVDGDNPNAGGGWPFILSDLKTLLETGSTL
jgi:uncharacterized protein YndB with AHSA1/START domain